MTKDMFVENRKQKEILIHVSVWVIFAFFNLLQTSTKVNVNYIHVLLVLFSNISLFYVNYLFLVSQFLLKKKIILYVVFVTLLVVLMVFLFSELEPRVLNERPGTASGHGPRKHFKFFIPSVLNILLIVTGTAVKMYNEWSKNEINKKEIEVQKSNTELHFLKHQLSPHFLFNSLNSIYSLTNKKSSDASEAVITLSELMRYMLYETNNEFVSLNKELDYVHNYLKLQRLRIANNENVTLNIKGNTSDEKIRPLLLISFIENAFKYGTDFKGNTEVKIEIQIKENELNFTCQNLIGTRKTDKDHSGIGLNNTKERLELLYPDKHVLLVEEKDNRFVVNLTLELG
ncbi:MAG: histidine kinase [Algibacter sp.]